LKARLKLRRSQQTQPQHGTFTGNPIIILVKILWKKL